MFRRTSLIIFGVGIFLLFSAIIVPAQTCPAKDYDCQIAYYQGLIKTDPKNTEAYYNLAASYQNKRDYEHSVAMYDIYLASGVTNNAYLADAYSGRAYSKFQLQKYDSAISDYSQAIDRVPNFDRYYYRGWANSKLKNYAMAIADLTLAIGLKPDDSSSYFERGYAYMVSKDNARALPDFTKVMTLDPTNVEAYYNRGTIYYRTKEYAKSIADLDKYIALNQADKALMADGYENRGLAQLYSGNADRAVEDFTKAIELLPRKSSYSNRADAYRKLNKTALAAADDKKAAQMQ
jgi:tetratricopeptide (TPR) repeat protein